MTGRRIGSIVAAIATAVATVASAGELHAADVASFAIVVGSNQRPSPLVDRLRFGDDDAVQSARTFQMLGAIAFLLASLDDDTRQLFPAVRPSGPASTAALRGVFDAVGGQVASARAAHRQTRLYFVFAGHGDITDGRAFLQLDDQRLWREDLAEMLRRAAADESHVIIDTCNSQSFVSGRGPGGAREIVPTGFSRGDRKIWPAHTGFLIGRSWGGQAHEWAEFQAGIFSHEVRSALAGAADANLDSKISYREVAAFIHRANESIPNRRYRTEVTAVSPGADLDAVFATLPAGPMVLELDLEPSGRIFVESEGGARLVDLNAASGTPVQLRLPIDSGSLFVRYVTAQRELRIEPQAGRVRASAWPADEPRARARGAAHEAFLQLFARPFDGSAVATFQSDRALEADVEAAQAGPRGARWKPWVVMGIGAAALGAGAVLAVSSWRLGEDAGDIPGTSRPALNDQIERRNQAAWISGGLGAALAVTGLAWWLLGREAP